jgi:hypothetical protein
LDVDLDLRSGMMLFIMGRGIDTGIDIGMVTGIDKVIGTELGAMETGTDKVIGTGMDNVTGTGAAPVSFFASPSRAR